MLLGGDRQVADDVEAVAASDRPARDDCNHDLRHESDEPLHFQDVEPPQSRRVDGIAGLPFCVLVPVPTANSLIATRAEGPAAVFGRGAVASEEHTSDIARLTGVVQRRVQLIDAVGPEGVADLGAIERDADSARPPGAVIGDVGEVEPADLVPACRIE